MASDPHADRIRLVIEPGDKEPRIVGPEDDQMAYQHHEDAIDLGRLDDDSDYEFEDEESPPARRRVLPLGLAGLALAGFGAIAWYAYQGVIGSTNDEMIPLIQADSSPIKTRPLAPGGLEIPYQDKLVLNDLTPNPDKPQVERLLPPPEVPKPPVVREKKPAEAAKPQAAAGPSPDTQAGAAGALEGDRALVTAPKPRDENQSKTALNVKPAAKEPSKAPPAPKAAAAPVPPKAEATPKAPPIPAQTPQIAAIPGGYLIQLASLKDKKLAGGEWVRLRKVFPELLAGKKLVLQEADLGSRGVFHRLRAGYFPDRKSAAALCQALQAKNQACIVVKL